MKQNIKLFFGFLIIAAVVVWVGAFSAYKGDSSKDLKIYFLNVGQGDSEYIKTPSGNDILIDGGPDSSVLAELGKVMDLSDRRIDLIVLTHPHADHLTGLIEVVNRFEIGEVWETGVEYSSGVYDEWKNLIKEKGINNRFVMTSDENRFGDVRFLALTPLLNLKNQKIDNVNNASIVTELEYGKFTTLFLGDLESDEQEKILGQLKPTTVVKVAHHGAKNGLNESLYKITRPAVAVFEVGAKNNYGHPHAEVLDFLKSIATQIYRTDQNNTVQINSDGLNWTVK